jgi:hypothetical protein
MPSKLSILVLLSWLQLGVLALIFARLMYL